MKHVQKKTTETFLSMITVHSIIKNMNFVIISISFFLNEEIENRNVFGFLRYDGI